MSRPLLRCSVAALSHRAGLFAALLLGCAGQPACAELDPASGLVVDAGFEQVRAQCVACHSLKLVTQNRADAQGWTQMIRWMQEEQGLWPLGEAEPQIIAYLAKHYGPVSSGRRASLPAVEYYRGAND